MSAIDDLKISDIFPEAQTNKPFICPWHGAKNGGNLVVYPNGTVHCMRCHVSMNAVKALGLKMGVLKNCTDSQPKGMDFIKIKDEAENHYGIGPRNPKLKEKLEKMNEGALVWTDSKKYNTWDKVKKFNIKLMKEDAYPKFILAHNQDEIIGKAQLVYETIQKIRLLTVLEKKIKIEDDEGNKTTKMVTNYKFIDDPCDKRYDGHEIDSLDCDFLVYRVISGNKEYFVFSKERLGQEVYKISGMNIDVSNFSDLTNNLKFKSMANIFFACKCKSNVITLEEKKLLELTKKTGWKIQDLINLTFLHPDGNIYIHTDNYNKRRVAQLFSGKYEGYPLAMFDMGPAGSGKTYEAEALNFKFQEDQGILEAANSTPKALIPSYKEKPANPGYVLKCNRVALIDELIKLIADAVASTKQGQETVKGQLSKLNMLLEHKLRTVGSGNDNSIKVQATAKTIFWGNPLEGKNTIYQHVGIIDNTTLSRMLTFVHDKEEMEFFDKFKAQKDKSLYNFAAVTYSSLTMHHQTGSIDIDKRDKRIRYVTAETYTPVYKLQGESREDRKKREDKERIVIDYNLNTYRTIYDSCQKILCDFDYDKVEGIFKILLSLTKEPMKTVFKARGFHHCVLILDGITKLRCLFEDYDASFTATDVDYASMSTIMTRIVKSWDTNLEIKEEDWSSL